MTAQRPTAAGPTGPGSRLRKVGAAPPPEAGPLPDRGLLTALMEAMEVGLCAMAADGSVTHWNREAERLLGWPEAEAVGRPGLAGWAVREADADAVAALLRDAAAEGRHRVQEFALLTRDGRRVLVRAQVSAVAAGAAPDGQDGQGREDGEGGEGGLYFAFSEARAQVDLERSLGLSEALFDEAPLAVVLVDADLRPAAVGASASRALGVDRGSLLGHPLGEVLRDGVEELESALQHVLATGEPLGSVKLWATLRDDEERRRRCWRSQFVRLGSPLGDEPVPLGVAWLFEDVTEREQAEQEGTVLRFRATQLRRAGLAAAECEDPMEGAVGYLDFVLAGFADHAYLDLAVDGEVGGLVRAAASPLGTVAQDPGPEPSGIPVRYAELHPALRALERGGTVCVTGGGDAAWAVDRRWPSATVHGLCTPLRSRGRTVGVLTFLRGPGRRRFDRSDLAYAEDIASRVAAAVDLAGRHTP
ncbi:PAS domain-containing protein [Peterkaempfera bronchialis]|uniref:PAS domain-containing protein n=1 Tax=Peterkaempfera bronchialis TaxID=2126346 RepID=A0A345SWP0_9ACTN|nr:PAS domain-containing protein [Peterkaempfera bronchialis]